MAGLSGGMNRGVCDSCSAVLTSFMFSSVPCRSFAEHHSKAHYCLLSPPLGSPQGEGGGGEHFFKLLH